MYHTIRLYRASYDERFEEALVKAALAMGGQVQLNAISDDRDKSLCVGCSDRVTTLHRPYAGGDYQFFKQIAIELNGCVWMEARIQDSALWDYSLMRGGESLDTFSALPEYWEGKDELHAMSTAGRPDLLAAAWQIPRSSIDRYLIQWSRVQEGNVPERAYPSDQFPYGDYSQFSDFVRRLGGEPYPDPRHSIIFPEPAAYKRMGWRGYINRILGRT